MFTLSATNPHELKMDTPNHPHPGSILRDLVITPLDLSVSEAAQRLDIPEAALSRVLNDDTGISPNLAHRLELAGFSTARFWIALQAEYDRHPLTTGDC
jgi:addiction module HigA family antidote